MFFLLWTLAMGGGGAQAAAETDLAPGLDYLVGEFRAEVERYDRTGAVSDRATSETRAQRIFDGRAIEQTGVLVGAGLEARSFYYVDRSSKVLKWAAFSSILELNLFSGSLENGELTLVAEGRAVDGRPLRFKRVDSNISDNGYELAMYVAEPGKVGDPWTLVNRQFNRRVERGRAAAEALRSYAGVWTGEEHRETPNGEGFRFRYVLEPLDAAENIYEMTITQTMDDGEERLVFKGFKAYDRRDDEVRYDGFSPSGRVGRGRVLLVGDALETVYEGGGPDGARVTVKDVFTHLDENRFRSVTFVRRDGEATWQRVNEDHWRRAEAHVGRSMEREGAGTGRGASAVLGSFRLVRRDLEDAVRELHHVELPARHVSQHDDAGL